MMRKKLMIHYGLLFVVACSLIIYVNVLFMWVNIYNIGGIYGYDVEETIDYLGHFIDKDTNNQVILEEEGIQWLKKQHIGIQILNANNQQVFAYNKPVDAPLIYTNKDFIEMYTHKEETMFLGEKKIENQNYTYLVFLDSEKVKRTTFEYDVTLVQEAHKFPTIIIINLLVLIIISFLFTLNITAPLQRVMDKILKLSQGIYTKNKTQKGVYEKVEEHLNELGEQLAYIEKERKELDKMREEWISTISHDIKTPLTSIIGNTELLEDTAYPLSVEEQIKCCETILRKSEYIKSLVDDLNLSARLKNNTLTLRKKEVNVVSVLRHIVIDMINDHHYSDQGIQLLYEEEIITLWWDEPLMKRVFVNLISNAFVHNNHQVRVTISIKKRKEQVIIEVKDNGCGVQEQELERIFNRYYRGTNTTRKIEGSGLGMAIAHDIVKAHDGTIQAMSKWGEGLSIYMVFNGKKCIDTLVDNDY